MSDLPEIRAEIDERGRMSYHATCEGVLLSKDEQESIMRKFADLQHEVERLTTENANMLQHLRHVESENAKLRELVVEVFDCARRGAACETCKVNNDGYACVYIMRDLEIEVE